MKKIIPVLLLSFILVGCDVPSSKVSADESFRSFTNELFCENVSSSTLSCHYTLKEPQAYNIDTSPISFGSFSQDKVSARASLENYQHRLNKFPYNALSQENQLTYDVLSYHLQTSLEGTEFLLYEEPLTPVTGIHTQLPILLAEYSFDDENDVKTYLSLLETFPTYFDSLISFEKDKYDAGLFMSNSSVHEIVAECSDFLAMGTDNYLLSSFEERLDKLPSLSAQSKQTYARRNETLLADYIYPSYQKLISALCSTPAADTPTEGLCHLPQGAEFYSFLVSRDTGSSRSIEELERLIRSQMSADLIALQKASVPSSQIVDTYSPKAILEHLKQACSYAFPTPASVSYEIKQVPKSMQPHLSPAFYLIPPLDDYTENVIYINPAHNSENGTLYTTLAHEGYPGHLYQTTYFSSKNPDPIRHLLSFDGYVEGWATYAEMCSYSLLPGDPDYYAFLQKNASFILGMYAMADIGIHYHGWQAKDTISFFQSFGIQDEASLQEVHNYIVASPANYLKYYIGYVEILELKKKAIDRYGDDFSQKDFHKRLLEIGPAPFAIIEKYLFS